jgi:hypothetical protein
MVRYRNFFWLASERNYLVVKQETRRSWRAGLEAEPYSYGEVTELKQVSPGLWFPMRAREVSYDPQSLYEDHTKVLFNTTEWSVSDVSLNPDYDIGLFRDIAMPAGGAVHTVRAGKIVHSTRAPRNPEPTSSWRILFVVLNILVIVFLFGVVFVWRWRRGS